MKCPVLPSLYQVLKRTGSGNSISCSQFWLATVQGGLWFWLSVGLMTLNNPPSKSLYEQFTREQKPQFLMAKPLKRHYVVRTISDLVIYNLPLAKSIGGLTYQLICIPTVLKEQ